MTAQSMYIRKSFELNLFFLRIMKEHALFLQLGFTPKDKAFADEADELNNRLNELLRETIQAATGYVSNAAVASGELFTQFTEEAERQTQYYTGVPIDLQLTREEYNVGGDTVPPEAMKDTADRLNRDALALTAELLQFKQRVLEEVLSCRMFTNNSPLEIDHILREAQRYVQMLRALMAGDMQTEPVAFANELAFWNQILKEHAEFTDGLLDPTEDELIEEARALAAIFDALEQQARMARRRLQMLPEVTIRSENATEDNVEFKTNLIEGLLSCHVRSVIIPLLSDHMLREANFYLRVLRESMR